MKRHPTLTSERDIREALSNIKNINKSMISIIYSTSLDADNDGVTVNKALHAYTESIREIIGSINEVNSERILKALGFNKIGSKPNKFLIPANAIYLIKPGTEVTSITGEKCMIDDIDLDSKNGMLGYYITIERIGR